MRATHTKIISPIRRRSVDLQQFQNQRLPLSPQIIHSSTFETNVTAIAGKKVQ